MKEFENINDILDFAINSEQEAVDFYTKLANNAKNDEIKEVFFQFAKEEVGHKAKLTKIKETGMLSLSKEKIIDLKISDYIVSSPPSQDMTYQDALIVAMKKEKSAFKLYSTLAQKTTNNEVKELFLHLAQEEAKHKLRFELEYDEFVMKEN
ncbi:MAG: ferritin family protein [Bacteroidales bacterium]|nr:ferritin family protein [Bacteroidales bacterium]